MAGPNGFEDAALRDREFVDPEPEPEPWMKQAERWSQLTLTAEEEVLLRGRRR